MSHAQSNRNRPTPRWLMIAFPSAILAGILMAVVVMHVFPSSVTENRKPPVHVHEQGNTVSFSVTAGVLGEPDAVMLIHDEVFQKWNVVHPDKQLWKSGQNATVTFTFNLGKDKE